MTTIPGRAVPAEFFSVAVKVAGLEAEMALLEVASVSVFGATVVVPVVVEELELPPPQPVTRSANAMAKQNDIERDKLIFNMDSRLQIWNGVEQGNDAQRRLRASFSILRADAIIRVK